MQTISGVPSPANEDTSPTMRVGLEGSLLLVKHPIDVLDTPAPKRFRDDSRESEHSLPNDLFPRTGNQFLEFQIVEELGRGSFGRVYLATQGQLSGRLVAIKVSRDILGESQTLAQLQHSYIVPIYSFHRRGELQVVCMPFFGRTTLADVLASMSGRVKPPHSGRELKSTINRHGPETIPSGDGQQGRFDLSPAPTQKTTEATPGCAPDGWDRLEGLSFVEACLFLGAQLADGLSHAHRRGILHRDLKPANVLLTDDGRPMLLDFNLAEDTKLTFDTERLATGGTLPYMAPEQLRIILDRAGSLDERGDIFALGIILFELLTGHYPYPPHRGTMRGVVEAMYADRQKDVPSLRQKNREVSPDAEAIVQKCLAANPANRYQRADDLRDDIERHLANRPLKFARSRSPRERISKWARRHPRLSSTASVAVIAAVLLLGAGGIAFTARDRAKTLDARASFQDHRRQFADVQLFLDDRNQSGEQFGESLSQIQSVLDRYGVDEHEAWLTADAVRRLPHGEREQLRADIGEAYYRMGEIGFLEAIGKSEADKSEWIAQALRWNDCSARLAVDRIAGAIQSQREMLTALRDNKPVTSIETHATALPRDLALTGGQMARVGRFRDAVRILRQATQLDPTDFSAWFVRGTVHLALEQNEMAVMSFGACLAIRPDFAPAWRNRGLAFSRLRFDNQALEDYDRAIQLDPLRAESYLQRAVVRDSRSDLAGAEADYTSALGLGTAPVRTFFLRADIRERMGEKDAAIADRDEGLRHKPTDELSWIGRAEMRVETNPQAALDDVNEALALQPFSMPGLQMKAHILGERLKRDAEAIDVLNLAVERFPESAPARAGRGVLLARQGKRQAALRDAEEALLLDSKAPNLYQVGCIYALTVRQNPDDKTNAFRYLWSGLKTGFGLDLVDTDSDLDAVRNDPEFKRMIHKAKTLHEQLKP
jgi:serine/threonine protein kinase/Flp pilus assembly protein TadD